MREKINQKAIRWFLDELPRLVEEQVIVSETGDALRNHYQQKLNTIPDNRVRTLMIVLGGICAAFIGLGFSLIIAHNWDELPASLRIIIGFLPLIPGIFCGYYALFYEKGASWQEPAVILCGFGIPSSIAVVAQIYNLGGSLDDFLSIWLILLIPLLYLFRSAGGMLLALIVYFTMQFNRTSFIWGTDLPEWMEQLKSSIWFLLVILPMFWTFWKERESVRAAFYRYLIVPAGLLFVLRLLLMTDFKSLPILWFVLFGVILTCGINHQDLKIRYNPLIVPGFLGLLITGLCFSFPSHWSAYSDSLFSSQHLVIWGWFVLGAAYLIYVAVKKRRIFYPLVSLGATAILLITMDGCLGGPAILMSLFCLGCGIWMLRESVRKRSLLITNGATLLILSLATEWFLSGDFPILIRGIGFIVLGGLFGLTNLLMLWYLRRMKRTQVQSPAADDVTPNEQEALHE